MPLLIFRTWRLGCFTLLLSPMAWWYTLERWCEDEYKHRGRYCFVGQNSGSMIIDRKKIYLHWCSPDEIVANEGIVWINLVLKKLTCTQNSQFCSAHFVRGSGSWKPDSKFVVCIQAVQDLDGEFIIHFVINSVLSTGRQRVLTDVHWLASEQ